MAGACKPPIYVEVAVPYNTMLPEPMMLPWTASFSLGVELAKPTLPEFKTLMMSAPGL